MSDTNLTVEKLQAMMDALPPRETWALWSVVPQAKAWRVTAERENLTILHPATWHEMLKTLPRAQGPSLLAYASSDIRPVSLDDYDPLNLEAERIRNLVADKFGTS